MLTCGKFPSNSMKDSHQMPLRLSLEEWGCQPRICHHSVILRMKQTGEFPGSGRHFMEAPHHIIALVGFPQQSWCRSFSQNQWPLPLLPRSPPRKASKRASAFSVHHLFCRVQESSRSWGESGILRTLPCKNNKTFGSDIEVPVPPATGLRQIERKLTVKLIKLQLSDGLSRNNSGTLYWKT